MYSQHHQAEATTAAKSIGLDKSKNESWKLSVHTDKPCLQLCCYHRAVRDAGEHLVVELLKQKTKTYIHTFDKQLSLIGGGGDRSILISPILNPLSISISVS